MELHLRTNMWVGLWLLTFSAGAYEVSTEVSKKNVLLEEFTGLYCGNCPDGHVMAEAMWLAHPDQTFVVAVHSGYYATPSGDGDSPDYRIDEGEEIDSYYKAYTQGYPCGMLNRTAFNGSDVAPMSRSYWMKSAKALMQEDAPVNLRMEASVDAATRVASLTVEGYFTADLPESATPVLNVLWTQSHILGYQNGGGIGNNYDHKHMLRGYVSASTGDAIDGAAKGRYFQKTYTFTLPEAIKDIAVLPENIEFVAFVSDGRGEVMQVTGVKPACSNLTKPLAVTLAAPRIAVGSRYGYRFFEAVAENLSNETLTTLTFDFTLNGRTSVATWTGSIPPFSTRQIAVPVEAYDIESDNAYALRLTAVNGTTVVGETELKGEFTAPVTTYYQVTVAVHTDEYADENTYCLRDEQGEVVRTFGPYPAGVAADYSEALELEPNRMYCLEVTDAWGDGVNAGYLKVYGDNGRLVAQELGVTGAGARCFFRTSYHVSADVQRRKALLEEFTGIHCGYCPQGHAIGNRLVAAQPDSVFVINVHTGPYADPGSDEPDFRTEFGDSMREEFEVSGYPCGTVNRHAFEAGGSVITSRSMWAQNCKTVRSEDALVNLWMSSRFDGATRQLSVKVEGYYTGTSDMTENRLNVAWTQTNILGPQLGAGMGDEYVHRHMLRGYLTPDWGEVLTQTTQGTYFVRDYVYTLPEDLKGVAVKAEDIQLIAFVCEGKQDVLNVTGCKPVYENYSRPAGLALSAPSIPVGDTYGFSFFEVMAENLSDQPLTKATFDVTVGGVTKSCSWSGELGGFQKALISITRGLYDQADDNVFEIRPTSLNGEPYEGEAYAGSFGQMLTLTPKGRVELKTDLYADENTWTIKNRQGKVVYRFGPYPQGVQAVYTEEFDLEENQLYCLEVTDCWADGVQQPKGYCRLYDSEGQLAYENKNIESFGSRVFFTTSWAAGIDSRQTDAHDVRIVQEGASLGLAFSSEAIRTLRLYSADGMPVWSETIGTSLHTLSTAGWPAGLYLLGIEEGGCCSYRKIRIQ